MVCASKGYPLVCVMSESFSIERRKLMRFLGAKVVLTNPAHKVTFAYRFICRRAFHRLYRQSRLTVNLPLPCRYL
jgi:cysteine synthase